MTDACTLSFGFWPDAGPAPQQGRAYEPLEALECDCGCPRSFQVGAAPGSAVHDSQDTCKCDLLGEEILMNEIVQPAFARAVCAILDLNPLAVSSPPFPLL